MRLDLCVLAEHWDRVSYGNPRAVGNAMFWCKKQKHE